MGFLSRPSHLYRRKCVMLKNRLRSHSQHALLCHLHAKGGVLTPFQNSYGYIFINPNNRHKRKKRYILDYRFIENLKGKGLIDVHPGAGWRCPDYRITITPKGIEYMHQVFSEGGN